MPLELDHVIAAIASAPGPAERGIIRITGEGTRSVISAVFRQETTTPHQPGELPSRPLRWETVRLPHRFTGWLELPSLGVPLPAALMFWPTKRSFTGQPMAELHLIGAPPLMDAALERVLECGARPAKRGEFTMRAFLSGRIDLLQAEAVLGVIDAADHTELQQALTQLGGGITSRMGMVRSDLVALLGDLEAGLDFVDEDIEFISSEQIIERLSAAESTLIGLSSDSHTRLPSGWKRRIVLAGLPNAGKSTLFNCLTGEQRALVSPIPGTTRDYLSAEIQLEGLNAELIDTAGTEDAADLIMSRAQQLSQEQIAASDLIVWCSAATLSHSDRALDESLRRAVASRGLRILPVITRCDQQSLLASHEIDHAAIPDDPPPLLLNGDDVRASSKNSVSAVTGLGIDVLRSSIAEQLLSSGATRGELVGSSAARCRDSLRRSIDAIQSARNAAAANHGDELIALEIRDVLQELAAIMGEVYTDDILDHIFSSFCIGK